ncbi:hypothetical protein JHK87_020744 [Glycine soja]|nr:hypothetical protein JHK87_020744 [Glycine soja]KAG5024945.1 hypothetical protein JHK86_020859 [Glycine max]
MGRKAGTLFINPKRFGNLQKPCMKEMALFLSCMAANHSDTEACARQKELLNVCIDAQLMSAPIVQGKIPNRHGPARACGVVVSVKTATHINSDIIPA